MQDVTFPLVNLQKIALCPIPQFADGWKVWLESLVLINGCQISQSGLWAPGDVFIPVHSLPWHEIPALVDSWVPLLSDPDLA